MAYVDDAWITCMAWAGNLPLTYDSDDVVSDLLAGGFKTPYEIKVRKNQDCSKAFAIITFYTVEDADALKKWGISWRSSGQYAVVRSIPISRGRACLYLGASSHRKTFPTKSISPSPYPNFYDGCIRTLSTRSSVSWSRRRLFDFSYYTCLILVTTFRFPRETNRRPPCG